MVVDRIGTAMIRRFILHRVHAFHLFAVRPLDGVVGVRARGVALAGVGSGGRLLLIADLLLEPLHGVVDEYRAAEECFRVFDVTKLPNGKLQDSLPVFPEPELCTGEHRGRGRSLPRGVEELLGHASRGLAAVAVVVVVAKSRHLYV